MSISDWWSRISRGRLDYQMELIYSNQLEIKRQLDRVEVMTEWLYSREADPTRRSIDTSEDK